MSERDFSILINELLSKGDIKCYSEEGSLVSLTPGQDTEDEEFADLIKNIEQDFREDAEDILKRLELSHLKVAATDKVH